MESGDRKFREQRSQPLSPPTPKRVLVTTLLAGLIGGGAGLVSKHRKALPNILAACYCAIGEPFSGALLGRLQGGPHAAFRYMGTACDYAARKARPKLESFRNMDSLKLPEWSPIRKLDEEAIAKKKAQEQKIFAERALGKIE